MKFLIITHVEHKQRDGKVLAYAPYVREMNLWAKFVTDIEVVSPVSAAAPDPIDLAYDAKQLQLTPVQGLNFTSPAHALRSVIALPRVVFTIYRAMQRADHIHLRCPGNMGLTGCFVQMLFPGKPKTAKYAGNWDRKSPQPRSYRLQQSILKNPFLTRNMAVLVYGNWPDKTRNIVPFFTASYREREAASTPPRLLDRQQVIRLIFVGTLTANKRPALAVEAAYILKERGFQVQLDLFGAGVERTDLEKNIREKSMQSAVLLHGNVSADAVQKAYQSAHFLLFASRSEGWPKAVAEAMFWGCLPITTPVSCVPEMLGKGTRGDLVAPDAVVIANTVAGYVDAPERYAAKCEDAMKWSRRYTLEHFEAEIGQLLKNDARTTPD